MKKLFILFAAVIGFAACSGESGTLDPDFSKMSTDEVLNVEGGMEYLLSAYGNVNVAAIHEQMQNGVLQIDGYECTYYRKEDGVWKPFNWFGTPYTSDLFIAAMDGGRLRMCYANIFGEEGTEEPRYFEWQNKQANAWEGALMAFVVGEKRLNLRAVAHLENKIVVSYTSATGEEQLQVWVLRAIRQEVFAACTRNASEQFKSLIEELETE